jgi:hypothetical protein
MDRLIATLIFTGTFCGGVFGNILAHDICQFTPRVCRRLIERAVRVLPNKQQQERYLEEWLAHLADCTGVLQQYRHAAGCILGARRLRREIVFKVSIKKARFEFDRIGVIDLDPSTALAALYFLAAISFKFAMRLKDGKNNSNKLAIIWIFISSFCAGVFYCRKYGGVNNAQLRKLIEFSARAIKERHNAVLDIDGKRIDFAKILQSNSTQ